jgi:SAM-dependent methyltransferase
MDVNALVGAGRGADVDVATSSLQLVTEPDFVRTTRAAYDAVAVDYARHFPDELVGRPWDQAVLSAFAELVGDGPVADVGSGTGRTTAYLHGLGVDVFGIDLSPGMLAVARRAYPHLRLVVGSMLALGVADASLRGVVAYYSTIYVPDERLGEVLAEFRRVLAPGGHLVLAFQVGDEPVRIREAFGRAVELDSHRRRPERVASLLEQAGLAVRMQMQREPEEGERTPQAYLVARRP